MGEGRAHGRAHRTKRRVVVGASSGRRALAPGRLSERSPNIVRGGDAANPPGEIAAKPAPRSLQCSSTRRAPLPSGTRWGLLHNPQGGRSCRRGRWRARAAEAGRGGEFPKTSSHGGEAIQRSERPKALQERTQPPRASSRPSLLAAAYCQHGEEDEQAEDGGDGQEAARSALQGESIARV